MLGTKSLIVDREERIGDNWRSRYHQLVLHDPVWFDHLPYIPFPESWPVFTPKVLIALNSPPLEFWYIEQCSH
jgi:cation diffusion facilitator CzcD-associated flavoprotein CzcO